MKIILSKNSKIQGLIVKDLLQLKNYKRTLISFIVIFAFISILQALNDGGIGFFSMLPAMITIVFGMVSTASFNYDEASKADRYIRSLPVNTKEIILSKFIFTISATIIGAILGIILTLILIGVFLGGVSNILEILATSLGGILGVSILEAIQIPCIYKFGAEKARMHIFVVVVVLSVIIALLVGGIFYWIDELNLDIWYIQPLIPIIFTFLILFVYRMSYKISYKIYEKKEF